MINNIKKLIKNRDAQKQFIKYLIIGGSTAIFELILYAFLRKVIDFDLALSNVTAVAIATLLNFMLNKGVAFKGSSNFIRSLILYIILFCLNTIFSTYAITIMVQYGVLDILAKLITMALITAWNFILYRRVIFK